MKGSILFLLVSILLLGYSQRIFASDDDKQKDFHINNLLKKTEYYAVLKFVYFETHDDEEKQGGCECDYVKYTTPYGQKNNLLISGSNNETAACYSAEGQQSAQVNTDDILKMHTRVKNCPKKNSAKMKFSLYFSDDQLHMADLNIEFHRQGTGGKDKQISFIENKRMYFSGLLEIPNSRMSKNQWSTDTKITDTYNGFNVTKGDSGEIKIKPSVTGRLYIKNDTKITLTVDYNSNQSSYDENCVLDIIQEEKQEIKTEGNQHVDINLVRCEEESSADMIFSIMDPEGDIIGIIGVLVIGNNKEGSTTYRAETYSPEGEDNEFVIVQDEMAPHLYTISVVE